MKEVYFMDTRFEFNIKKVSIKGDDQYLYLYFNNKLRFFCEGSGIHCLNGW